MSDDTKQTGGALDLALFAKTYFEGRRLKLTAVLVLQVMHSSISGIGLLLILPLLGLLGFGTGWTDNPLMAQLSAALDELGLELTLGPGLALFVGAICLRAIINWRRATWQVEVEQDFQISLRNQLYETLARTELYWLQRLRTSEFVQATQSEIRRAQEAVNALFQLVSQTLNLGAYFVVALLLSVSMTLFALIGGGLAALIMLPLVRRTHALSREQIRIRSGMIHNLIEHIQGLRTARSLDLTERFVADYRRRSAQAAGNVVHLARLSALSTLVFDFVAVLLLAAVVYAGLMLFAVEPARFVVLILVFIRIFPAIGELQLQIQRFTGLVPSFRHYRELLTDLQRHEESLPGFDDSPGPRIVQALEMRNVTFSYHALEEAALRDVSVRIERGALTAIGGQSGAGKSTLVDIATGLLPPGTGGLLIDGHRLNDQERVRWRRETALVPQESFLFDDSIRANLACVRPEATEQELWEVLDAANCRAFVEARHGGLDSTVGERGGLLSGGERQRLSIARALLRRPQLLVLDEPTNNLDKESVAALLDIIEKLKRQATLLIVSHDPRVLQRADRIYLLEGGAVVSAT
ncbi:MAG: ABC transporter ATP-binding protein/permease [Gammaproteobacteria bacterium]|nr:ABC transporter ATP-binding protein/permease [Gammaproteobacteria bacterium]